ncbi:MAG: DUF885 family protein [Woeseia sp.]
MKKTKTLLLASVICAPWTFALAQGQYEDLVSLDAELMALAEPDVVDDVPDLGVEAIEAQRLRLERIQRRLRDFNVNGWPVSRQVDYLVVWAKLNDLVFDHRVMRPWAKDPLLYLYQVSRVPYAEVPIAADGRDKFVTQLKAVPGLMIQAQTNLSEPVGELAKLAVYHLENFDGVGQRQPHREKPPEGTIGWFEDLCARLQTHDAALVVDCRQAASAVKDYRDWLRENLNEMPDSAAIGVDNLNWYLKHVRVVPYTVDDLQLLGEREFHRYRFNYIVDRNKNKELPELTLTRSAEQHLKRTRDAENKIRSIVVEQDLLTIPDYMPDEFETDTYWSPRGATNRHFWEELQFRDALNNHIHASIPGHRFDTLIRDRLDNPIRRNWQETARAEGWGTYLEELLLQAGITDDNPRARELFDIALIKRGSRIFAETSMHSGQMSLAEANAYMIDWVPFMEENLGRYDLANYLRRPGAGSMYILGKTQIEQLVSERAFQFGDKFDLGDFHDEFLSKGVIPVTLIRWEMTGHDNEVRALWPDVVGRPYPSAD